MLSIAIAFLTGGVFAGLIGIGWIRLLSKAKVPESCHEECKRIKNMEHKFDILESDNRTIINERNNLALEFANKLNGHD
jgi:hypothetical protein